MYAKYRIINYRASRSALKLHVSVAHSLLASVSLWPLGGILFITGAFLVLVGIMYTSYIPSTDTRVLACICVVSVAVAAFGIWERFGPVKSRDKNGQISSVVAETDGCCEPKEGR